ncbi:MAG TPA: hypothetical protein VGK73_20380 [Polyangiaceae bacterium]
MKQRMRVVGLGAIAAATLCWSQTAFAIGAERMCGTSPNGLGWDVMRGGLAVSRSNSLPAKVLKFIGENWSHSMLSHGPGQMVTTANMWSFPGTQAVCSNPLIPDEIRKAGPGATRMNNAGNYASLYLMDDPKANAVALGKKSIGAAAGDEIADFFEARDCDLGLSAVCRYKMDGSHYTVYSLFQYNSIESSNVNDFGANKFDGAVCSTLLAGGQYGAKGSLYKIGTKTYTMVDPDEPSENALRVIYDQVYDRCMAEEISWLENLWCDASDSTLCARIARQVVSVFVNGSGSASDSLTADLLANEVAAESKTISPQGLATELGSSLWYGTGAAPVSVSWNSQYGASYGCWAPMGAADSSGDESINAIHHSVEGWLEHTLNRPPIARSTVTAIGGGASGTFAASYVVEDLPVPGYVKPLIYRLNATDGWTSWGHPAGGTTYPPGTRVQIMSDATGAAWAFIRPSAEQRLYRKASATASWTYEVHGTASRAWAVKSSGDVAWTANRDGRIYRANYPGWAFTQCGNTLPANRGEPDQMGYSYAKIWLLTTTGRLFMMTEACAGDWIEMIWSTFGVKSLGTGAKVDDVWITDSNAKLWNLDSKTNTWYRHYTPKIVNTPASPASQVALDMKGRPYYLAPSDWINGGNRVFRVKNDTE